jgi:deoxyguanosine kinase
VPSSAAPKMERARYIAVEGPMGAGKSALAGLLADRFGARLVLDPVDENPFLAAFHADRRKHAFQAQLFFLISRYQLQQELFQQDLFNQVTVADHLFAKDRIFAALNLDPDELALYRRVHAILDARTVKPDLVVFLQARLDVLVSRVRRRGRELERHVEPAYLEALARAYNEFFFHYEQTPLLVVNTSELDLAGQPWGRTDGSTPPEIDALVQVIRRHRKGIAHYNPAGSR